MTEPAPTPVANDFTVSENRTQTVGSVTGLTVTAKDGKTTGTITTYYTRSGQSTGTTNAASLTAGSYAISIDVTADPGKYSAVTGLFLNAVLVVNDIPTNPNNKNPEISHYTVTGPGPNGSFIVDYDGGVKQVTTARVSTDNTVSSPGTVTVSYTRNGTTTSSPSAIGVYVITLTVAPATDWNGRTLAYTANALQIIQVGGGPGGPTEPVLDDFYVKGLGPFTYDGNAKKVDVLWKEDDTGISISVFYKGETAPPKDSGTYPITFTVGDKPGWETTDTVFSAGNLVINKAKPTSANFAAADLEGQVEGNVHPVSITSTDPVLNGRVSTIYYNGTEDYKTLQAGIHAITFDVDVPTTALNWESVSGLFAAFMTVDTKPFDFKATRISFTRNSDSSTSVLNASPSPTIAQEVLGYTVDIDTVLYDNGTVNPLDYDVEWKYSKSASDSGETVTPVSGYPNRINVKEVGIYTGTITGKSDRTTGALPLPNPDWDGRTATVTFYIGVKIGSTTPNYPLVYKWADEHGRLVSNVSNDPTQPSDKIFVAKGGEVIIEASAAALAKYEVVAWIQDGAKTNVTDDTYSFISNIPGPHTVTLIVKDNETSLWYSSIINLVVRSN